MFQGEFPIRRRREHRALPVWCAQLGEHHIRDRLRQRSYQGAEALSTVIAETLPASQCQLIGAIFNPLPRLASRIGDGVVCAAPTPSSQLVL